MSEPIRVLQVVGRMHRGGLETFIMNVYRNIDRSRLQFDFLVHYNLRGDYDDEIESLGGRIYRLPVMENKRFFSYLRQLSKFFSEHTDYKIIHLHWTSLSRFLIPRAKKNGVTTVIAHSHNTQSGRGLKGRIIDFLQRPIQKQATHYFACSKAAAGWFYDEESIRSGQVKIIPNAIDTAKFAFSPEKRLKMRIKMGAGNQFVILHVGRFSQAKNHSFLLDIFAELRQKDQSAELWLIGQGEDFETIQKKADAMGLAAFVKFLGTQADIASFMQAADVFLFPSLFEGLAVVTVEAQASGLPVVTSTAVSPETNLTGHVDFLSLSAPASEWAAHVLALKTRPRVDLSGAVREHNYDIKSLARDLQGFYLREAGCNPPQP